MRINCMQTVDETEATGRAKQDFEMGRELEKFDREQALEFYAKAADAGDLGAKHNRAVLMFICPGIRYRSPAHLSAAMPAFEALQELAENDYPAACYNLSFMYEFFADFLDPDSQKKSNYWFARSRVLGFSPAS